MTAVKQRPFAFSCCLFLLFSFIFFLCGIQTKIIFFSLCLISGLILIFTKLKSRFALIYIIPPILISSVISICFFSINYQNILTYSGNECDVDFVITDNNYISDDYSSYIIQLQKIDGKKVSFKASLSFDGKLDTPLYSSYSARVKFSKYDESQDGISYRYSNLAKGIYLNAVSVENITYNNKTVKLFPSYYFQKMNDSFASCIDKYITGEASALCQALLLGNKDELSSSSIYNFRTLGLSHMLAVSGMHLSILIGSIGKLVEKINISKKKRYLLMMLITFVYAGITGFSPSVKRASIMLILYYLSFLVSKNHDPITALCFSVSLVCFISPNALLDIGLWLSFLSTYGILAAAVPMDSKITEKFKNTNHLLSKALMKLLSSLIYGIIPIMFSIPIIWISYGEIAVLSPVTNILFTPFLLAIMYTCPLVFVFSSFPFISKIVNYLSSLSANIMLYLTDYLADYSPIGSINYDFTAIIIVFFVISLLVLSLINIKRKSLYFIPFICSILIFSICAGIYNTKSADTQKVIYTNTLNGDAFLVISQNQALLCDVSGISWQNSKMCEYYLGENQLTRLDGYVITDYKGNGTDTLDSLTGLTKLKTLYMPYSTTKDEKLLEEKFKNYALDHDIETIMYDISDSDQICFFGINIDIKKLAKSVVNSPSSICVTFSNSSNSFAYIGTGSYTTNYGKGFLTKLFNNQSNILFGNYGKDTPFPITSLLYKSEMKLFFPNEDVYNLCSKTIPKNSNITFTDSHFEFSLNR